MHRITRPGRLHSVHVMQLPATKTREGYIGMRDFRGDVVRAYLDAGWVMHSEVCIWKDPVVAQQRTKSIRLLHKQLCKDSTLSGQAMADYILTFRKLGDNEVAVSGMFENYAGDGVDVSREAYQIEVEKLAKLGRTAWDYDRWVSIMTQQRYASPVWTDIRQTRTLQYRSARDEGDENHISPLQLDVIERCIDLWSNPGETVFTPFMGIGSEVYVARQMGRKGIGCELKESYWKQAVKNVGSLDKQIREREEFDEMFG